MMVIKPVKGEKAKELLAQFGLPYRWEVVLAAQENDEWIGVSAVNSDGELTAFAQKNENDLQLTDGLARAALNYLLRRGVKTVILACESGKEAFTRLGLCSLSQTNRVEIEKIFHTCRNCGKE